MSQVPFQLVVKRHGDSDRSENLTCNKLLRIIPAKREVYDANWQGREVIAKIFLSSLHAKRHLSTEWRRLSELRKRGINAPEPLFRGVTQKGHQVIAVEKITNSQTLQETFSSSSDKQQRTEILTSVCVELARQHDKGILQKDLHLGNFMSDGKEIFTIDPGQMAFYSKAVGKRKSLIQLASLACIAPEEDKQTAKKLLKEYTQGRNWTFSDNFFQNFEKLRRRRRSKQIRKGLKKSLRTSTRHLRLATSSYSAVFDRKFCDEEYCSELIDKIDTLMDDGTVLKRGNTTYVSRITFNGKDVVVKRYNYKGILHTIRHTIKANRARSGWLHGHRLGMFGIATPKPVAYIERKKHSFVWQSYLITEYLEGKSYYTLLRDQSLSPEYRSQVTEQVMELIQKLARANITHGDMKHSNILITNMGPTVIDLDAMTAHRCALFFDLTRKKDLKRLRQAKQ